MYLFIFVCIIYCVSKAVSCCREDEGRLSAVLETVIHLFHITIVPFINIPREIATLEGYEKIFSHAVKLCQC